MTDYTKFYKEKQFPPAESLSKNKENVPSEADLKEYKELIQQLGYRHFDD